MALAVRPPHDHTHLRPLTYDEVQQFPDDGYRYELVDGELLVTPAPNTAHQRAITQLTGRLLRAAPDSVEVLVGPVDWYVRPTTCFEPDLVVVRRDARSDHQRLLEPPVLVVEVLSPSTRYRDVGLKRRAYEDACLGWYWVVDPLGPCLTVHRLVDGGSSSRRPWPPTSATRRPSRSRSRSDPSTSCADHAGAGSGIMRAMRATER